MSTTHIILLVVLLLGLQAAVWVAVFLRLKRQREALEQELSRTGETVLIGPQRGHYAGGTPPHSMVKSIGVIALTRSRLVFLRPLGPPIEVPVARIAEVGEGKWFRGHYRGGRAFLVLKLDDGSQVGFQVREHHRWRRELAALMPGAQ
ncbi:MAG: hypothetical protein HPY69_02875 [Armatimonadetes bacterium]|nr:hypothetical protein [Armatimonadota bacterium]